MHKISVVIASWNKKKITLETLSSVKNSDITGFSLEIVVVDNNSGDGSQKAIADFFRTLNKKITTKLIINPFNYGFAEANNIGMRHALKNAADFVLLLNDDTEIDKSMIKKLLEASLKNKDIGAVSPKIYFAPGFEFHKDRYSKSELGKVIWSAGGDFDRANFYGTNHGVDEIDKGQFEEKREIDFASGCSVLLPAKVLDKVGLFNPDYFAYLEDVDLSFRIKKAGFKIVYVPEAKMWHKVSQSSAIGSELNDYFITRNRLILGLHYAGPRTKFALFRESIRLYLYGRKWQKTGVLDFYRGKFGRGSWK